VIRVLYNSINLSYLLVLYFLRSPWRLSILHLQIVAAAMSKYCCVALKFKNMVAVCFHHVQSRLYTLGRVDRSRVEK
jgi:hypothetical protein